MYRLFLRKLTGLAALAAAPTGQRPSTHPHKLETKINPGCHRSDVLIRPVSSCEPKPQVSEYRDLWHPELIPFLLGFVLMQERWVTTPTLRATDLLDDDNIVNHSISKTFSARQR